MALEAAGGPPEETLSLWKREQARLKAHVVDRDTEAWQRDPAFSGLQRVGGVDVSFVKGDSVRACASLVVLSFPELEVVYEESRMVSLTAPYVSGFLAFREVPFLLELVQQLREKEPGLMPQVLLVDGNGVLHHRGFGVACHLGVLTDLPCVGVAKKLLQVDGLENNALHKEKIRLLQTRGDSFPLLGDSGTVLGMPTGQPSPSLSQALRSHDRSTRPLYISVGHRMSLEAAVRLTCCCCRFRIPEPVRQADICSREHIRKSLGLPGPPTPRSPKAQRPVACPKGDSGESSAAGGAPSPQRQADRTTPGGRRSTAQHQVGQR
ncbi:endonuclease V isoform X9 [Homo sapiens]|uniref:endonuclease V isoform X9 n=1 Tax=Homo sapiens TaxID=9606 RepID=UPI0005CFFDA7|nr:endonuclease V isoform X9 [Homo sapiens]XP_054171786.1 endonuclease V isoform X9 [Homo sapiens]|eukprot:XP_011522964.1 endonuclease V isoform X7 [Homo sapiens]